MKFSIIIPNWNGKKLLEKNLPAVLASKPDEIIVVDDASADDSVAFIKEKYPEIKLIVNKDNIGFARSCNNGVIQTRGDIVVLLNNDVVPEPDFLVKVTPDFENPEVFAVSFNEPQWSWAKIYWKEGFIEHKPGIVCDKPRFSGWASGGSSAFRKSIWTELGGFDEIYYPFYWEDIDLSYRAWKRGYKVWWDPKAIVHHKHEGTIGKHFSKNYIDRISARNQLIFIWSNVSDQKLLRENFVNLFKSLKNPGYLLIIISALLKLPKIIKKRKNWEKSYLSDTDILNIFND
jgi:GT2 family glycosyltransferase